MTSTLTSTLTSTWKFIDMSRIRKRSTQYLKIRPAYNQAARRDALPVKIGDLVRYSAAGLRALGSRATPASKTRRGMLVAVLLQSASSGLAYVRWRDMTDTEHTETLPLDALRAAQDD